MAIKPEYLIDKYGVTREQANELILAYHHFTHRYTIDQFIEVLSPFKAQ